MAYDLLIRNGRIVDGTGAPAFRGDVGVRNGKIVEIGKLRNDAARTIDAGGMVVAPGFIDNHCHYDAQVTWDPLCSFSCYHGVTTVIIGNCSLTLAPVRRGTEMRLAEFLSYVEAIPMEALRTVNMEWETTAEYMAAIEKRLGVNVGNLIGHSAVRHYVMGDDSQGRAPSAAETESMRGLVRDGMTAGALGLSITRQKGHFDPQGVPIPAFWADENEIFALGDVLAELGTGVIQAGGGREAEIRNGLMSRLSEATGRPVVYNSLIASAREPDVWKQHMALVDKTVKAGIRAYPTCSPSANTKRFTMRNSQIFKGVPTWHPILLAADDEKLRAYADPGIRRKLHKEVVDWEVELPDTTCGRNWYDTISVEKAALPKNKSLEGKSLRELAQLQGKGIIDAFLDLVVEESLDTGFVFLSFGYDRQAMTTILNYPNAVVGLSDAGAHVQFQSSTGFSSRLLGYWVRQQGIMSVEQAVKRLTSDQTSLFGIYDRGMLRPGLAADITIFDPDTIDPLPQDVVHDYPAGAWRVRELAKGVCYTIVNGQVLIENGVPTGSLPGRVIRNSLYHERARRQAAGSRSDLS
jgi:N-acyl-D-amino-acid deacylase